VTVDEALPDGCVDALLQLWRSLPTAPKDKPSPIDRSYYADTDGCLCRLIDSALERAGLLPRAPPAGERTGAARAGTQPLVRFLHYATVGGSLPAHVDLPRLVDGARTTHSFLLYLTDCETGGETLLLEAKPGDERLAAAGGVAPGERRVVGASAPRRGRLLIVRHCNVTATTRLGQTTRSSEPHAWLTTALRITHRRCRTRAHTARRPSVLSPRR
jgi:hypothetical protein